MPLHCDPEDLALMALGEVPSDADTEHVEGCPECRTEVESLRHVVSVGRSGITTMERPPGRVWQAIQAQIHPATDLPQPRRTTQAEAPAEVVSMESARQRRRGLPGWSLAAAAAVGAILGGSVVANVSSSPKEQVIASAQLAPLPDGPDRGTTAAASLNKVNGSYTVTVKAGDLPVPDGFYEVWLLDEENAGLIALGSLTPGEKVATFPVPDGISLERFRAVDISDEPLDGDPTHSTVTVLRGTLDI